MLPGQSSEDEMLRNPHSAELEEVVHVHSCRLFVKRGSSWACLDIGPKWKVPVRQKLSRPIPPRRSRRSCPTFAALYFASSPLNNCSLTMLILHSMWHH